MSNVFGNKYKVTSMVFNLRKCSSLNLNFTSKTAGCATDLVKDFFTEHLPVCRPRRFISDIERM